MKNSNLLYLCVAFVALLLFACKKDDDSTPVTPTNPSTQTSTTQTPTTQTPTTQTPTVKELSIEKTDLTLVNGENEVFAIVNGNLKQQYTFKASPEGIVSTTVEAVMDAQTVKSENIRVVAQKAGTTIVTLTDNVSSQTTTFKVTITAAELTIAKNKIDLTEGDSGNVSIITGNPAYSITSSAINIATAEIKQVSGAHITSYYEIVVKGVSEGTTTLTLKDEQNKTVTIAVTIKAKNDIFEVDSDGVVTLKAGAKAEGAIKIPDSGKTIGTGAFRNNTEITSVDFNNVTRIEGSAFLGASKLTTITMRKVTEIENTAFANCKVLKTITVETATPPTVQRLTFNTTGVTVYVPKGAKTAYEADANWKKLGEIKEVE